MSGVRGKVRVLIATTAGPVEVLRLTEEDAAIGRSVVCVDGTTTVAGIAADYQAFVASPTGIVERLYGHPCYRLDVSKPIDAGSSWQLGAIAAHALHASDRLAQEGEPCDAILLATGSVRAVDLKVRDVTHVNSKIEQAFELLRDERQGGRQIIVAVPSGSLREVADNLRSQLATADMRLVAVEELGELTQQFGLRQPDPEPHSAGAAAAPALPAPSRHAAFSRQLVLAASALLAVGGSLFAAQHFFMRPSADPAVAESKLFDGLWHLTGEGGEVCPLKSWTAQIVVVGGWILISRPEKGFVRPTGEFRFTSPARVNPSKTNEFTGRLFGTTGKGEYRAIGGQCAGTFTMARVEK